MIRRALKLWVGSRLIEQPWRVCGNDTFGMDVCVDMGSPYYGRIPVTPIMDFQLDNITIHYLLVPWKSRILKELQKKILGNRKEDWLEVHLTMFILLNNVERQVKHDNWFARRYSLNVCALHVSLDVGVEHDRKLTRLSIDSQTTNLLMQSSMERRSYWHTFTTSIRGTCRSV